MNKRLFFALVMLFAFAVPAMAYDFSAVAPSGQTLYYNIMNGEAQVTDNGSYNVSFTSGNDYIIGDIVIPSTVTYNDVEYTVTSIGSNAFYGCSYITSIVLPNTLTTIGSQSFYGCRIANLIVPDGVTSIGNWAFVSIRHIEYHGYASYSSYYPYWNAASMNGYTEGDFVYSNESKTNLWAYIGNDESVTIPSTVSSIGRRAFEYCSNLTYVTLHNGITSIDEYAFLCCENLTSVNIPGSVSSIGNGAFSNTGITSATINDGVESIGDYAFEGCSKLTSINIPNSVTNIGRGAFMEDTLLATVTIGTGLSTIEPLTFYYCYNLSSIEIHSPITYIGGSAFIDCWSLTEFEIPSTVTTIAGDVFSHCTGIVSMTIPSTVTSIGNNAFERIRHIEYHGEATGAPWGALSMNGVVDGDFVYSDDTKTVLVGYVGYGGTVVVPSTVNTIVAKTFAYGESITSVTIPNTVLSIGDSTFFFCRNMLFANIPDYVMEIREATFYDCFSLDSVYIGESVASIGDYSFYLCAHLSSINARPIAPPSIGSNSVSHVPSNVKIIVPCGKVADYQAANGWSGFTNIQEVDGCSFTVTVAANDDSYGSVSGGGDYGNNTEVTLTATPNCGYRFVQWKNASDETVSSENPITFTLTSDTSLTAEFEAVDKVLIGSLWYTLDCANGTATVVPQYDTYYDTKPTGDIIIPSSVTYGGTNYSVTAIGGYAFYNCSGITSASIPNSVTTIGEHAFYYCYQMISITIPNSVTIIEGGAFEHCGMNTVILPNSIIAIGNEAFKACLELTSITIPVSVTSIGERVFSYCSNLTSMSVASGNTHYDSRDDCNAIIQTDNNTLVSGCKTTVVPSSVTAIGNYAFYACSGLTSIILPSTVTSIGASSFSRCSNLEEITSLATIPPTMPIYDVFYDVSTIISVYVPCGTVSSYQAATGWSRFSDIQEIAGCSFTVTVTANDDTYGTVSGSGDYDNNTEATLTATPNCGYRFVQWNDGNTDNPRIVTVTDDVTFTATFETADKVHIGSLWYTLDCANETATVVAAPYDSTQPTGDIVIPSSVTYGGTNYSVTSIGDHTFEFCSDLTSINIPSSITSIGLGAFGHCSGITSLTIPSGVTFIGYLAFTNCIGLTSISVESGNTVYDSRENCNALIETATNTLITGCMNTVIPEGITSISDYAFVNCEGLASVTIPSSVTHIGEYAFDACRGITSLTIEEGVNSIDRCAFSHCIGITSLTLPGSITTIGNGAFLNCSTLTSIKCLATVPPTIEFNGFYNVPTTIPVYVPCGKVTNYQASNGWSDFTNIQEVDGCSFTVTVAANDDTYGIVSGSGDYDNNTEATLSATPNCGYRFVQWNDGNTDNPRTVTVTEDVTYTATFDVADKVQIDGLWYTLDCANGTATVVPENDNDPYYNTFPTGDLVIPSSITYGSTTYTVTAIGAEAFEHCGGLTSVIIPNTVTTIGEAAFSHCTGLTSLTIPSSVTSIGFVAFRVCSGLTSIVVEAGNPVYDSRNNCNAIIETATDTLIKGCKTTVIPNTVTVIGYGSFTYCTGMTSLTIPNSVTTIDGYAFYGSDLTSITIPNSVTTIGEFAFWSSSLTSVDIPNSVTTIGGWAFGACANMTSVTIPSSVTSLSEGAFSNCSGLTSLICLAENPPTVGLYVFNNIPTNIPVYVPCGKVADYQAANDWSSFTNIQEVGGCIPAGPTNIAVYADGNDIVVEGATGNTVTLYDNTGNTLATSIAPAGTPLRFETLDSGTYFIKIGILPARMKVEVQ